MWLDDNNYEIHVFDMESSGTHTWTWFIKCQGVFVDGHGGFESKEHANLAAWISLKVISDQWWLNTPRGS